MDFNTILDNLDSLSFDQLDALVKKGTELRKSKRAEKKEADKAKHDAEKAEAIEAGRSKVSNLSEGDKITIVFKNVKTVVTFVKMTEKRFTVEIDGAKRSIMFDKFVGMGDLTVEKEVA